MATADLTLAAPLTVTTTYGQTVKFSAMHFDAKSQRVEVIWETWDGAAFTGKYFRVSCDLTGTTYYYTDGTTEQFPTPVFTAAGVQNIIAQATLATFGQAKVK